MDKILSKPPIYLAIAWLAVKIILHNMYPDWDTFMFGACLNILFVFAIILMNLRNKTADNSFLSQLKNILKSASLFIFLTGISVFVYYEYVHPEYIQNKIDGTLMGTEKTIEDAGGWDLFVKDNPSIKQKNQADFLQYKADNPPAFLNSHSQALIALMGLLLMAIFWSIIFLVVSRKALIPPRQNIQPTPETDHSQSEESADL